MREPTFLTHDWFPQPLPPNVEIGPRSWIYSTFAFVHYQSEQPIGLRVGHDSGLYNGTFFDLGPNGSVEVGNYCSIVGAIIATNGRVRVGDYSFIAHEVVLADHFAPVPPNIRSRVAPPRASNTKESDIVLGSNVWIGARAVVLAGSTIGEGCIIGAGAVVKGTFPPLCVIAGNPATTVGRITTRSDVR